MLWRFETGLCGGGLLWGVGWRFAAPIRMNRLEPVAVVVVIVSGLFSICGNKRNGTRRLENNFGAVGKHSYRWFAFFICDNFSGLHVSPGQAQNQLV